MRIIVAASMAIAFVSACHPVTSEAESQKGWAYQESITSQNELHGDAVVPPVSTTTIGIITVWLERKQARISLAVPFGYGLRDAEGGYKYLGLSSAVTRIHFHKGAIGKNGPILYSFPQANTRTEMDGTRVFADLTWKVNTESLAAFRAGEVYCDIHTEQNPNGELRAQIKPASAW